MLRLREVQGDCESLVECLMSPMMSPMMSLINYLMIHLMIHLIERLIERLMKRLIGRHTYRCSLSSVRRRALSLGGERVETLEQPRELQLAQLIVALECSPDSPAAGW